MLISGRALKWHYNHWYVVTSFVLYSFYRPLFFCYVVVQNWMFAGHIYCFKKYLTVTTVRQQCALNVILHGFYIKQMFLFIFRTLWTESPFPKLQHNTTQKKGNTVLPLVPNPDDKESLTSQFVAFSNLWIPSIPRVDNTSCCVCSRD